MVQQITEAKHVWHNGALIPWADATVHVLSSGVQFGSSVFEGIRCYETASGAAVFRLREHLRRLADSCRIYRIDLPYSLEELERACLDLVKANGFSACYLRPMVMRGFGDMSMASLGNPVETYIAAWVWGQYLNGDVTRGLDVCVSSWNRPAPNTFPALAKAAGHYNNATLIKLEALANGYSEAIALAPDGMVSEGSGQNLFLVRDGVLMTPPVGSSILSGITRASVIDLARARGIPVEIAAIPRELLYVADEAFLAGTATEIAPIGSVDRISLGNGGVGPITKQLRTDFLSIVTGRTPDKHGWLTSVS